MQTRQQRLAKQAYTHVSEVTEAEKQKYGTMAHKLPILIRTAGLAQALAFVQARGSQAQHKLLDHLAEAIEMDIQNGSALAEQSREAPLAQYILLTQRVMAALVWYKRFVESLLKVEQRDADDSTEGASDETEHA